MNTYLAFVWDPLKGFNIFGFTLHFYSMTWIAAFLFGFNLMKKIYKNENQSEEALDKLFLYGVVSIMLGARLGHVIFYQPELFKEDFFSIFLPFSFRGGIHFTGFQGLASHGAAIGLVYSMYLYNKRILKKSMLWILDRVAITAAIGGAFIRIGNFINSEIIGIKTDSNFGVIFKQLPVEMQNPRHPAQLYESISYLIIFAVLYYTYWKTNKSSQAGFLVGLYFVLTFTVRFFVEFIKEAQVDNRTDWALNTGQWLSIPLILLGLYLIFLNSNKLKHNKN
jgi:phosphatidylglycerol---prolipoprotein diacylglyceryl transferase